MKKNLRGTKTLENLMKSFAGESQAKDEIYLFCFCCWKRRI